MIHFFCSTPLQIYTSIVLSETDFRDEKKKIYIIDYFNESEEYVSRLKELGIFVDVIHLAALNMYERIKAKKHGYIGLVFWNLYYYGRYAHVLKKLKINIEKNDSVFFSYLEPVCLMLTKLNKKRKMQYHFLGFEDGIGAYTIPLERRPGKIERYMGVNPYYKKECYWVYRPELLLHESKGGNVRRINSKLTDELRHSIKTLWSEVDNIKINHRTIFFDDTIGEKSIKKISEVLSLYKDKVIVKKHPKRMDRFYESRGYDVLLPQSIPFECFLIENNLSNKVLINTFSSAAVNCIFMFDQRPTIVFLYEVIEDDTYNSRRNEIGELIENLRYLYGTDNKIYVPKTYEEFKIILKEL